MKMINADEMFYFQEIRKSGKYWVSEDKKYEVTDVFQDKEGRWYVSLYPVS